MVAAAAGGAGDRGCGAGREHPAHRRGAGTVNTGRCGARTCWTDTLCGLTFRLSVPSFYQVNRDMAEVLYRYALWTSRDSPGTETVLDLYCGAGTITQVMARHAATGHRRGDRAGGHRGRQSQRAAQRRRRMWSSSAAMRRQRRRISPRRGLRPGRDLRGPAPQGAQRRRWYTAAASDGAASASYTSPAIRRRWPGT